MFASLRADRLTKGLGPFFRLRASYLLQTSRARQYLDHATVCESRGRRGSPLRDRTLRVGQAGGRWFTRLEVSSSIPQVRCQMRVDQAAVQVRRRRRLCWRLLLNQPQEGVGVG